MPDASGYDVGTAFVTLTLSLKGIQRDAAKAGQDAGRAFIASFDEEVGRKSVPLPVPGKPESKRQGTESGGAFADAFTARVKAALKSLPKAKVRADATEADAELQRIREKLAALGDVKVGVDLSAAEATAELNKLKTRLDQLGASSADPQVQVDAAHASAQLAAVQAQVDKLNGSTANIKVDADTAGAESRISRLTSDAGRTKIKLGFDAPDVSGLIPVRGLIGGVAAAAVAGAPALFALSSSLLQASTSAVALIPAMGGAAFAIGTLTAALSGPLGALKAYRQAQDQTAQTSTRSASTELSNARAVRSAQDGLADARRQQARTAEDGAERIRAAQARVEQATRDVADAERDYSDAQADARRVQLSLNDARSEALRQLADMREQVSDLALDEEGAALAVKRAQQRQAEVAKDAKATALDREEAAYAVKVAQQRLADVQAEQVKAAKELADAEKKGVNGSAAVVKARDDIAKANRRVGDAAERVADAQRGQTEAERGVTAARRDAKQAQDDASRSVTRAAQAIDDLRVQQAAQAATAVKASAASQKYAKELAKLTPEGRRFLRTLIGFGPEIDRLKAAGETATLPGFTRFLLDAKKLLPQTARGITLFGRALGDSAADLGRYVSSPLFRRDFATLIDSTSRSTRNLGAAVTPLSSIMTSLAVASAPLLERFTAFILRGLRLADVFLLNKRRTGELEAFFSRAGDTMARWGRIVGNFAGGLLGLFRAANPAGKTLSERLESVSEKFEAWAKSADGSNKLRSFFQFFADFDYRRLVEVAKSAGSLYLTFAAFKTAGSLARNPFFFLIALAAIKNPEAVSGFVGDVYDASKPLLDFLAAHPNVFTGMIALLGALRLTAAAAGMAGLLKGLPGLSGLTGGGGGPIAGLRDVRSRKPGSLLNPIVTAGGGDAPSLPGGKTSTAGRGLTAKSAGLAGAIVVMIAPQLKAATDRTNQKKGTAGDLGLLSALGLGGQGFQGLSGESFGKLYEAFKPVERFFKERVPGWAKTGFVTARGVFTAPNPVAVAGLGAAFLPVQTFFSTRVPGWAKSGFGVVRTVFTTPSPVSVAGLGTAFTQVRSFFTGTAPGWAKSGLTAGLLAFERPRIVTLAGLIGSFSGVRSFFLTTAPGWAGAGVQLISRAFGGLQTALITPINWIISNVLNRLIGAANFVITKFGGDAITPFPLIGAGSGSSSPAAGGNSGRGGRNIRLATGGVIPGYTPGRDVHTFESPTGGRLDLSGGEAVMRPEWTRAVGPRYVDRLNAAARRGGTAAVRRAMGGPGAFALGGIIGKVKSAADWGKAGIRTLQDAAKGGLRSAVEYLLGPVRASLENPQAGRLFASMTAGAINKMVAGIFGYADTQQQMSDPAGGGGSGGYTIPENVSAKIGALLGRIRSWDPLPYVWGATGPGGFDCSGITGAVYGLLTGRGGGSGQRYFTTSSNFEALGFRPGAASDYVVGVNPGTHMAGRLAGLPFEAQSTASGILVGPRVTPTSKFARQYYLPGVQATATASSGGGRQIQKYDSGGYLMPGLNLALNATGKPEPVYTAAQDKALRLNAEKAQVSKTYNLTAQNYGREVTASDLLVKLRNQEALVGS